MNDRSLSTSTNQSIQLREADDGLAGIDRYSTSVARRLQARALLQRVKGGGQPIMSSGQIENYLSSPGGGRSMEPGVQRSMEQGFGRSMGGVRIHTDSKADVACKSLGAQAFANGNNVYFAQGKYDPGSAGGRHLLAHELTHTVQQTGGGGAIQRSPDPAGGAAAAGGQQGQEGQEGQDQEKEAEDKGGEPQVKGGSSPTPAEAGSAPAPGAPGLPGQASLAVGKAGDRYEQEADRVADQVVETGFRPIGNGGAQPISGPTGGGPQLMPEISRVGGDLAAGKLDVQKLDPATISAAAAVVGITYQFVKDLVNQTADDVTWSFDRMNNLKHPGDNTNWGNLTGVRWTRYYQDFEWYRVNGFGTKTGMTVRINWEGNGYSINGVYFTKRSHNDAAGWGANFTWLVQNLMTTGTNAAGYPKARVAWECTASFTRTLASTIHGNWDGWIDAEGTVSSNAATVSGGSGTGGGMPSTVHRHTQTR